MRRLLTLLGFACLGACGSPPAERYAAPAYRAAVAEFDTQFGRGSRLWLRTSSGVGSESDAEAHLALVRSATDLPVWTDSLGPPHPRDILLSFDRLVRTGDDTLQLRAHTLAPFEVRGDTIRYDELVWVLQLRCRARACRVTRAEVVRQALFESVPSSARPGDPPA